MRGSPRKRIPIVPPHGGETSESPLWKGGSPILLLTVLWKGVKMSLISLMSPFCPFITMSPDNTEWFAIRTRQDFRAAGELRDVCPEVYFPTETVVSPSRHKRERAVIPHVLFIRTTRAEALRLEAEGRTVPGAIPLWVYRYPNGRDIQTIPQRQIDLLKLLTADDTTRCTVYNGRSFRPDQRVRVTGGFFAGYEGSVVRVARNRHVVVRIEGICLLMLPFIHPDLLQPLDPVPAVSLQSN